MKAGIGNPTTLFRTDLPLRAASIDTP